jgi:hypothetical protein
MLRPTNDRTKGQTVNGNPILAVAIATAREFKNDVSTAVLAELMSTAGKTYTEEEVRNAVVGYINRQRIAGRHSVLSYERTGKTVSYVGMKRGPRPKPKVDPAQPPLPDPTAELAHTAAPVTAGPDDDVIDFDAMTIEENARAKAARVHRGREAQLVTNKLQRIQRNLYDAVQELRTMTEEIIVWRKKASAYDKLSLQFRGYSTPHRADDIDDDDEHTYDGQ